MTAPAITEWQRLMDAADLLDKSDAFRVLRRFQPRTVYNEETWNLGEPPKTRLGLYVDVETTGLDRELDEIIELAMVPFTYDPVRGIVFTVRDAVSYLEEPRRPILPEIVELTGITPEMVKGQRIDDVAVTTMLGDVSLVIAHNAEYDRQMLERRIPRFSNVAWACSQREVPWKQFGVAGGALQNILMSACGEFADDAHRAAVDCHVGVHTLAAATCGDRTALSYLLESARQPTSRVCAIGSPMGAKDALRARGYRALYAGSRFAYWYKDLRDDGQNVDAELAWCRNSAYADPEVETLTAIDRYSVRCER